MSAPALLHQPHILAMLARQALQLQAMAASSGSLYLLLSSVRAAAGTVVEVGPGVCNFRPGDDVALEPGIPCWYNRASRRGAFLPALLLLHVHGTCGCMGPMCATACREGRYNLDPDIEFFATPPVHGSLAEVRSKLYSIPHLQRKPLRPAKDTVRHMRVWGVVCSKLDCSVCCLSFYASSVRPNRNQRAVKRCAQHARST